MIDSRPPITDAVRVVGGLWRWTAWHPEWDEEVGCVAIEGDEGLILVDPLVPDESLDRVRPKAIILTIHYHVRSACEILERRPRAQLWSPSEEDLACAPTHIIEPDDHLPGGLEALATARHGEILLWHAGSGSLIPGDVILGDGQGGLRLCPESWLEGPPLADLVEALSPLLDLPVERVIVSHREPVLENAREKLQAALEAADAGEDSPYR